MANINIRISDELKQFVEQLKKENNHDSVSAVIRELILEAYNSRRTERYLKAMEQRIVTKIDHLADLADL
jgi:Arc/MetJ-type ribon-helix-helix transcriptional regulator